MNNEQTANEVSHEKAKIHTTVPKTKLQEYAYKLFSMFSKPYEIITTNETTKTTEIKYLIDNENFLKCIDKIAISNGWNKPPKEKKYKKRVLYSMKLELATILLYHYIVGKEQGNNGNPYFGVTTMLHPAIRKLMENILEIEDKKKSDNELSNPSLKDKLYEKIRKTKR